MGKFNQMVKCQKFSTNLQPQLVASRQNIVAQLLSLLLSQNKKWHNYYLCSFLKEFPNANWSCKKSLQKVSSKNQYLFQTFFLGHADSHIIFNFVQEFASFIFFHKIINMAIFSNHQYGLNVSRIFISQFSPKFSLVVCRLLSETNYSNTKK